LGLSAEFERVYLMHIALSSLGHKGCANLGGYLKH
jgi:hypothetical protein